MQSNRITTIKGLDKLTALEELYLSHNGISKIENLDSLVIFSVVVFASASHWYFFLFEQQSLRILDLSANQISHLENLSCLVNLQEFWVFFRYFFSGPQFSFFFFCFETFSLMKTNCLRLKNWMHWRSWKNLTQSSLKVTPFYREIHNIETKLFNIYPIWNNWIYMMSYQLLWMSNKRIDGVKRNVFFLKLK